MLPVTGSPPRCPPPLQYSFNSNFYVPMLISLKCYKSKTHQLIINSITAEIAACDQLSVNIKDGEDVEPELTVTHCNLDLFLMAVIIGR